MANQAKVRIACGLLAKIDEAQAFKIATEQFDTNDPLVSGFLEIALAEGLQESEFRLAMHQQYHAMLLGWILKDTPQHLQASIETQVAFQNLDGRITHTIATHACGTNWVKPVLNHNRLRKHFDDNLILGFDEYDFQSKKMSTRALEILFTRMQVRPDEVMFVEDSPENMLLAKETFPELTTVLKTNNPEEFTFD